MKTEELRTLDAEELEGKLKGARRELYELRFKLAVGQLDDHRQIRKVRSDIARLLTVKRQRELGIQVEVPAEAEAPVATTTEAPAAEPEPESSEEQE